MTSFRSFILALAGGMAAVAATLPMSFEANHGSADPRVEFLSRGRGYTLFLAEAEAALNLRGAERAVVRMRPVGARRALRAEGLDPLPGKSHYLRGADPARWVRNVPKYGRVQYREVYPGVDLIYHGRERELEYDFVVAPGADPRTIRLSFEGINGAEVDAKGDLVLRIAGGALRQHKPVAYQEVNGARRSIEARYVLLARRRVGFEIPAYDRSRALVIDPVLSYSTYLGGNGDEFGNAVAVDAAGNVYMAGSVPSTNFPTTPGALKTAKTGEDDDAFVAKFSPTGALIYSTYLGGSGDDVANAIAVDAAGNAYVGGYTTSANFPTSVGALQRDFKSATPSDNDVFLVKLNPAGSALVYSTYLGGSKDDILEGLALDGSGNLYAVGGSDSTDLPTTAGAFQKSFGGGDNDGFVAKINPAATGLVYCTYLGGNDRDPAWSVAVDGAGNAYVTGPTRSTNFPTTPGAFQTRFGGGDRDVYVAKLNPAGSALVYSTFLGGNDNELSTFLALDSSGNVYVTGYTTSTNFPTTPGALQSSLHSGGPEGGDAFVTKLNASGTALVYSTYLGGSGTDSAAGIAVDSAGNAYVTGFTNSIDFPLIRPLQLTFGGGDAFVAKLNPAGTALLYSTFLGGLGLDQGVGITVNSAGTAHVVGRSDSANFPVTPGARQAALSSLGDAFFAKISESTEAAALHSMVHAASYSGGAAAPGEIVTLFGAGIGPDALTTLRLSTPSQIDTVLADTRVLFDGNPAPLVYVQARQVSAIVPYAVAGKSSTQVQVEYKGARSNPILVRVAPAKPGIFTLDASGRGWGAILNQDYTVNTPSNPAPRGSVVSIFASGEGQTDPPGVDGRITGDVLARPVQPVGVLIDGKQADALYAGAAPGLLAGVLQVNARIPANSSSGSVSVRLQVGDETSPTGVTVAVQ